VVKGFDNDKRLAPLDEGQIEAFIRGDADAFHRVYAAYRQRVFTYCLYYMTDEALAKDAFQEVFIKIHTRRSQLREPKALTNWLLTVTRSVCLSILRTRSRQPDVLSLDDDKPNFEIERTAVSQPENSLDEDDLRWALSKLPLKYREAFMLREFEGYEYPEIARLTGTSIPNIQVRLTRAKSMLREILMPTPKVVQPKVIESPSEEVETEKYPNRIIDHPKKVSPL
jgi:RNA polymerase sigma-70 factor, ECF subfamily